MPFVAIGSDGETVVPAQANPGDYYDCPSCDGTLGVRESHYRNGTFVCRHFWHPQSSGSESCGGESDVHKRMKSIVMSKASEVYPDATVSWEGVLGNRRADVLVTFESQREQYGKGIAIECQHKHESKDTDAVTQDFLDMGFSVLWLYEQHFTGYDVDFDAGDMFSIWPHTVPSRDEWGGYHGVVHWLRQEKPKHATVDVKFPPIQEGSVLYNLLKCEHKRAFITSKKNINTVFLPCAYCSNLVGHAVTPQVKLQRPMEISLNRFQVSTCSDCGSRTKPNVTNMVVTARKSAEGWSDDGFTTHARSLFPCPNCGEYVEYPVMCKSGATYVHPFTDIKLPPQSTCDNCDAVVCLPRRDIRLFDTKPHVHLDGASH